ncbi:hypothetical protein LSAT2_003587 [Lamellibrachia satsuma]|nr:hypothetical protein LSAT2_003587 [Lamellibrachia satsuma]
MFFKLKEGSRTRGHKAALVKEQCSAVHRPQDIEEFHSIMNALKLTVVMVVMIVALSTLTEAFSSGWGSGSCLKTCNVKCRRQHLLMKKRETSGKSGIRDISLVLCKSHPSIPSSLTASDCL